MFILPQFYYSVTQRQFPHEINSVNAILIFHDPVLQGISVIVVEWKACFQCITQMCLGPV